MNPRLRNAILFVHRWTGLTVGLLAVFAALTGLALVFRAQLQPLAERSLREVPACTTRLSLDEIVARASARLPGAKLLQLELFEGGYGASIVRFTDQEGVYVNSCTGAILGQKNRWAGFFGFAEWLHRYRFIGNSDVSEPLQGSVSLILAIVMVGGGLAIWWPSTIKALKNGLKLRWRLKGHAFELNLHRTVGAYAAAIFLLSTVTSLTFTFEWARHAIFAATGSPVPPKKPKLAAVKGAPAPAETLMARTLETIPDAREIQILFPKKAGDAVEVQALERDAPHSLARTYLYLDPSSAEVVRLEPYARASVGVRLYRWLGALHQGEVGGLGMQLILFAGILGVPVLGYTGISSYLRGRLRRADAKGGARARVSRGDNKRKTADSLSD